MDKHIARVNMRNGTARYYVFADTARVGVYATYDSACAALATLPGTDSSTYASVPSVHELAQERSRKQTVTK